MADHWEMLDLLKAVLALAAGIILGLERELKDKSAGLKTISVISLGSALFAIISYKVGAPYAEPTRIASYVVSGVGFIGAGVIFKDGVNVSGLTTAGIIWLAAAVGTAIGFGEFFLAATFMATSLLIVFASTWINQVFKPRKQSRMLAIVLRKEDAKDRHSIIGTLKGIGLVKSEEKKLSTDGVEIRISYEVVIRIREFRQVQDYLLSHPMVKSFSL
ncbi:MAG: MgtC/SapB family protein [Chitinophagaceae bacterium]|nr:MAG: MgtC/SapB family protein [Chitinophagaceae bacterium]